MKYIYYHFILPKCPILWGVGTLSNIFGGYISADDYMKGNDFADLKQDWDMICKDMEKVMKKEAHTYGIR